MREQIPAVERVLTGVVSRLRRIPSREISQIEMHVVEDEE